MDLAEDVLQVASSAPRGVRRTAEAEPGHFEDVAEPLRRDPHVVLSPGLPLERPRGKAPHLSEPDLDDPRGVLPERA